MLLFFLSLSNSLAETNSSLAIVGDAYGRLDFNLPDQAYTPNPFHPFDGANGFGIGWFGADISLNERRVGAQLDLRFGPNAALYNGGDADINMFGIPGTGTLDQVKQAYVSYNPTTDTTSMVIGKFDTPYGAEDSETRNNMNYTRGALRWHMQPLHHTGMKLGIDTNTVSFSAIVVNGWNQSFDQNNLPSLGLKMDFESNLSIGYLGGYEDQNHTDLRHFVDVVFKHETTKTTFHFNGNYILEGSDSSYGGALLLGYKVSNLLTINTRAEYLYDSIQRQLITGTLSFIHEPSFIDYKKKSMRVFVELRHDQSNMEDFLAKENEYRNASTMALVGFTIRESIR